MTDGVYADLNGIVSTEKRNGGTFMHVDKLNLILDVKKPKMSVAKIFNNNRILSKNHFFLNEPQKIKRFVLIFRSSDEPFPQRKWARNS